MNNHIHLILQPTTKDGLQKVLKPLHNDSSLSWYEFILTEIKIKNKRVASPLSLFISLYLSLYLYMN
jgi:REP element-mobilizing transposase RayT